MCSSPFLNKFRSSLLQIFFKLVVLKNFANLTGKHLFWSLFLIKLQVLRTTTLLKGDYCEIWEIFRNILFLRTSPVAASDSFRFPTCNFNKKRFWQRCFSVNFAQFLRTSFDTAPPDHCFLISKAVVRRCSVKKVFLKISQNWQESTCARASFLIKLESWGLQLY